MQIYEKKNFPRSPKELKSMYAKGSLSFDNAVQRSFVWKNTAKNNKMSLLIDSMIRGFPIPAMYCNCIFKDIKNRVYDFLDGKQRTLTVIKFLNDEFSLVGLPTFEDEEGNETDLNGLTYSELPDFYRDKVNDCRFTIHYFENMESEDAEEMFRRLNNGKSLTAIELARVSAVSKETIKKLGSHELFNVALKENSIAGYGNEDIVVKTWITLYSDKKSLEKRYTKPIMENTVISDDQSDEIWKIYDLYIEVHDILKNEKQKKVSKEMMKKTNLISLTSIFKIVNDNKISIEKVKNWLIYFFKTDTKDISIDSKYNENATGRETVTEIAVKNRMQILVDSFKKHIER